MVKLRDGILYNDMTEFWKGASIKYLVSMFQHDVGCSGMVSAILEIEGGWKSNG